MSNCYAELTARVRVWYNKYMTTTTEIPTVNRPTHLDIDWGLKQMRIASALIETPRPCPRPDKLKYDKVWAEREAAALRESGKDKDGTLHLVRAYRCHCGWYHVGRAAHKARVVRNRRAMHMMAGAL